MKRTIVQLFVYIGVGVSATAVDYSFFLVLTRAFSIGALYSNPFAYLFGNIVSFLGHRLITFKSHNHPVTEYARFATVTAIGLGVSQVVLAVLIDRGVYDLVAKAIAVVISGTFNYTANRLWAFRPR